VVLYIDLWVQQLQNVVQVMAAKVTVIYRWPHIFVDNSAEGKLLAAGKEQNYCMI